MHKPILTLMMVLALVLPALLPMQAEAVKPDSKQPVEITADSLEVLQEQNLAIFSGNVLARQGNITMKAAKMKVNYRQANGAANQIYKIEATGGVTFATPSETAQGNSAIYMVEQETIFLNNNVVLTRDKNVLKGNKLEYNMASGRSVVTGGTTISQDGTPTGGRVRGLFVPKQD